MNASEQREHDRRHPGRTCAQCPIERAHRESLRRSGHDRRRNLIIALMIAGVTIGYLVPSFWWR